MSNTDSVSPGSPIGFCGALFILFAALKLTRVIDWSWWWVSAPLWLPAAVFLAGALVVAVVASIARAGR